MDRKHTLEDRQSTLKNIFQKMVDSFYGTSTRLEMFFSGVKNYHIIILVGMTGRRRLNGEKDRHRHMGWKIFLNVVFIEVCDNVLDCSKFILFWIW